MPQAAAPDAAPDADIAPDANRPIPDRPWQDIAMDFATGLPRSHGYDAIWVAISRLAKARHFVPCRSTIDAPEQADMFVAHVFRLHSLLTP